MTAITPEVAAPAARERRQGDAARVVVSEWTKLHSLRSTRWSSASRSCSRSACRSLFAAVTASHWGHMAPHERADRHPLDIALAGVNLSQLAIAVLGVLVITGEYSTGMIRASFTAVPKRLPVLWAKVVVFAVVTFVLMVGPVRDRVLRQPGDPERHTTSCRSRSRTPASRARCSAAPST